MLTMFRVPPPRIAAVSISHELLLCVGMQAMALLERISHLNVAADFHGQVDFTVPCDSHDGWSESSCGRSRAPGLRLAILDRNAKIE